MHTAPSLFQVNDKAILDQQRAADISMAASKVFQPRAPISTREFFAGRWEQLTTVVDSISQTGLHIVLFGERGVGKTSLANIIDILLDVMEETTAGTEPECRFVTKINIHQGEQFATAWDRIFKDIPWEEEQSVIGLKVSSIKEKTSFKEAFGVSDHPSITDVRQALEALPKSVIIFDEFDRGSPSLKLAFTDLIKELSDNSVGATIVLVGVAETVDHLIENHKSIVRSVVQIQLPRMDEGELEEILSKGENALDIQFSLDAKHLIVRVSQGLPHYVHLIGMHSVREAANRLSPRVEIEDVQRSFAKAIRQAIQSIQEKYVCAIRSAHKDALYEKVILACAVASSSGTDALGFFHPTDVVRPLSQIMKRKTVTIATFQKHINEFCESARGPVLERVGVKRAFKYRFVDPLLPTYAFMTSTSNGTILAEELNSLILR